jgi:hypothetical protein
LIEKDGPDTCNHMVHKSTDAIPCIRYRTDFCYLCGEEVTSNYPHEEVARVGVNHFPEGVFQKCRNIIIQEKQAEINRLRKIKRLKNQSSIATSPSQKGTAQVFPVGGWEDTAATEPSTPAAPFLSPVTRSNRMEDRQINPSFGSNRMNINEIAWMTEARHVQPVNTTRMFPTTNALLYDQFDQDWDQALAITQASRSLVASSAPPRVALIGERNTEMVLQTPSSPMRLQPVAAAQLNLILPTAAELTVTEFNTGSPSTSQRLSTRSNRSNRASPGLALLTPEQQQQRRQRTPFANSSSTR